MISSGGLFPRAARLFESADARARMPNFTDVNVGHDMDAAYRRRASRRYAAAADARRLRGAR